MGVFGREYQATVYEDEIPDCVKLRQREDNSACITVMNRGWSSKLAHLPTVYQVSTLWAAERIQEKRVAMISEPTAQMMADPLTKLTKPDVLFTRGVLARAKSVFLVNMSA